MRSSHPLHALPAALATAARAVPPCVPGFLFCLSSSSRFTCFRGAAGQLHVPTGASVRPEEEAAGPQSECPRPPDARGRSGKPGEGPVRVPPRLSPAHTRATVAPGLRSGRAAEFADGRKTSRRIAGTGIRVSDRPRIVHSGLQNGKGGPTQSILTYRGRALSGTLPSSASATLRLPWRIVCRREACPYDSLPL